MLVMQLIQYITSRCIVVTGRKQTHTSISAFCTILPYFNTLEEPGSIHCVSHILIHYLVQTY